MAEPREKQTRLGLVGPVLPYRGGIAQYTTMLHRTLASRTELFSLSFKRQYPKWLYPGRDDIDPGFSGYREPGVLYVLDSLNPFTWAKACKIMIAHSPVGVVLPWWTVFWAPCFGFVAEHVRRKKIKIVFTCHNVMEHESSIWKEKLTRKVLSKGDSFLVTNRKDADKLSALVPPSHIAVHPIPLPGMFPPAKPDVEKRAGLELLFFGLVRPYKGLDVLIDAMHLLKDEDIFLTVAGEWWQDSSMLRSRIFHKDLAGKIEVIDRYLTDDETAGYFSRADVVVLPYRSATGTGVIPLAYHYGKPVIATEVGGLPEVVENGVSGRLVRPGDPSALASVIRDFLRVPGAITREGIARVAGRMTWDSLAACLLDLIKDTGE